MCFENLPIEFDASGNAHLKPGVPNPYEFQVRTPEEREEKLREIARKNGQLLDKDFDPVTRVAGALAFHSTVDLDSRSVVETNSMATLFRGYEVILRGRDPRDAAFISSRACGVCGGVHATTPPPATSTASPTATTTPCTFSCFQARTTPSSWCGKPIRRFGPRQKRLQRGSSICTATPRSARS